MAEATRISGYPKWRDFFLWRACKQSPELILSASARAGRKEVGTSVSTPVRPWAMPAKSQRGVWHWYCQTPPYLSPTRLQSSRGRRNAQRAALVMKVGSQAIFCAIAASADRNQITPIGLRCFSPIFTNMLENTRKFLCSYIPEHIQMAFSFHFEFSFTWIPWAEAFKRKEVSSEQAKAPTTTKRITATRTITSSSSSQVYCADTLSFCENNFTS